ncbi:plasmid pRiA4b ORF-3 family protein [Rubritalea marina]|uniref:plasmid pRiA4b ORF-3 family protein n=1 Tax=Rubritalea marina TaxID=361055 RepID=UPI00036C1B3C|nr:plasmid pRiA4b ORF-3 family protein [Rubritalea marina]
MAKQSEPEHYEFKVMLYGIEPAIWREVSIPSSATFLGMHQVIQAAMGWEDKHLHEFRHGKGKRLTSVIASVDEDIVQGDDFKDENELTLQEFFGRKRFPFRMLYRYDFREDWIHEIAFTKKVENDAMKPVLIDGTRNCPPEDAGGVEGYKACIEGDLEWLDDSYDPGRFDKKEAVKRLNKLKL